MKRKNNAIMTLKLIIYSLSIAHIHYKTTEHDTMLSILIICYCQHSKIKILNHQCQFYLDWFMWHQLFLWKRLWNTIIYSILTQMHQYYVWMVFKHFYQNDYQFMNPAWKTKKRLKIIHLMRSYKIGCWCTFLNVS